MPANLDAIRTAFCEGRFDFMTTAEAKMIKRGLRVEHLTAAICEDEPRILVDRPEDPRGPCCLVLGWIDLVRPLHVLVGYWEPDPEVIEPEEFWPVVCTVYEPEQNQWYIEGRG